MNKLCGLLVGISLAVSIAGCRIGQEAGGKETDVVIVCTDQDWEAAGPILDEAFSVRERTLHEQKVFDLVRVRAQDLELYRFRKNLILMGALDSPVFEGVLGEDARVSVTSGDSYMFGSIDGWITGQVLVMIVTPPDKPLSDVVEMAGPAAFKYLKDRCLDRIRTRIYSDGIEEGLKARMEAVFGWTMDLPRGYKIADEDTSGGFVSFIRHNPERVILVYWGFERGTGSWMDVRDEMSSSYLQGDKLVRDRVRESDTEFRGYEARRMDGHWENEDKVIGGPFVSYCFQDTVSGIYYMVDYNVFAPAKKKWPITGQMEWVAQTFTILR